MIEDLLWGLWNGITAWPLVVFHALDVWEKYPVYNINRDGGWYQVGFLLGAGSPLLGLLGSRRR
jgi:hypothetical protein